MPLGGFHPGWADLQAGAGRVLVVDDLRANLALLERLLTRDGYVVLTATNASDALAIIERERPDIILSDVMMPGSGLALCRAVKSNPSTRLTPVILVTSLQGRDERIRGLEAGADDFIAKPFDTHELKARVRSLLRVKRYTDDLDSAEAVIMSLALTIEARDPALENHCHRLASYARALGSRLALSPFDIATLERGAILHDIGKVSVPDAILLKPSGLTAAEFEVMKQHTIVGDRLCSELRLLRRVRPIVRHHHERLDGTGYPDGLRGKAVPLLAQVIAIVDVYDAMTTARPYKPAFTVQRALEELMAEAAKGWRDRALVEEFAAVFEWNPGSPPA